MKNEDIQKNRLGKENINRYGSKYKIIEYNNARNVVIQFDNGYVKKCAYKEFKNGSVKSPFCKSVLGIGYLGIGLYKTSIEGKATIEYIAWKGMFNRLYDNRSINKSYKNCSICESWKCFQNFADWYNKNKYYCPGGLSLDKDIKVKGNKIYSPETCLLVPKYINTIFCKSQSSRNKYPIGIYLAPNKKSYVSKISNKGGSKKYCRQFLNLDDAWNYYLTSKRKIIEEGILKYEKYIPNYIINHIREYKIEKED